MRDRDELRALLSPTHSLSSSNDLLYNDSVTIGFKSLCRHFIVSVHFWLVTYLLVVSQSLWGIFANNKEIETLLFIPMWIGSGYGVIMTGYILKSVFMKGKLITRSQREHMLRYGAEEGRERERERDREEEGKREIDETKLIDYDSLLLLRYFCFSGAVICFSFFFILISQVLLYLWYVEHLLSLWQSLIPLIILSILMLSFLFLLKSVSITSSLLCALFEMECVLLLLKFHSHSSLSWWIVFFPLLLIQFTLLSQFSFIFYLHLKRFCTLSVLQQLALFSHTCSLLLSLIPVIITIYAECHAPPSSSLTLPLLSSDLYHHLQVLSAILFLVFILTLLLVLYLESLSFSLCRAYNSPLPLSRSLSGWIPLQSRRQFHLLIGTISILNYSLQSHHHPDYVTIWFDPFASLCNPLRTWSICCSSDQNTGRQEREEDRRDERKESHEIEREMMTSQSVAPRSCGSVSCGIDCHQVKLFSEESSSFRPGSSYNRSKSGGHGSSGRSYGSVLDNPSRSSAQSPPVPSLSASQRTSSSQYSSTRRSLGHSVPIPVRKHSGELEGNEDDDF